MFAGMLNRISDEVQHMGIRNRINRSFPRATPFHETGLQQDLQASRDRANSIAFDLGELTDAALTR